MLKCYTDFNYFSLIIKFTDYRISHLSSKIPQADYSFIGCFPSYTWFHIKIHFSVYRTLNYDLVTIKIKALSLYNI